MNFNVRQSSSEFSFVADWDSNNQLQIQGYMLDKLVRAFEADGLNHDDPIIIVSAVGPPSTRKTSILNAIIGQLKLCSAAYVGGTVNASAADTFGEPRKYQHEYKFDNILVYPPIIIECDDGRRLGILVLDVCNNLSMSEDVYIKLVEFCFQASSLRVFSLSSPLRPVSWGQGRSALEASNLPELRQPRWKDVTVEWPQTDVIDNNKSHQISHSVAISSANGHTGLFQISVVTTTNGKETGVTLSEKGFSFIMQQIFSPENHCCKLSDLKSHFLNCGSNEAAGSSGQLEVIGKDKLNSTRPNASTTDSSSLEGSDERTTAELPKSVTTVNESEVEMMDTDEAANDAHEFQAANEDIQSPLIVSLKPEIDEAMACHFTSTEKESVGGLQVSPGNRPMTKDPQNKSGYAAVNIAVTLTRKLPQTQLPKDIKAFTSELVKVLQSQMKRRQEELHEQIKPADTALAPYLKLLSKQAEFPTMPVHDTLPLQTPAQRPTIHTASRRQQQVRSTALASTPYVDSAEKAFAWKASKIAIDSVEDRLLKYLETHGLLTNFDIRMTFNLYLKLAKVAFISVPGFDGNTTMWKAAWKSQELSQDECLSEIHRSNNNATRRWDRALDSALQKSTEFYNQQMDRCLPDYKISLVQLEKIHDDCVKKTAEKFSASSEIQKATIDHWKQILVKCKVEEWKEGYVIENENKRDSPKSAPATAPPLSATSTKLNSDTQSSQLAGCSIGIYLGPDTTTFHASVPDGAASVQFEIKPFVAFVGGRIVYAEEASATAEAFDVYELLTEFTPAPSRSSLELLQINGQTAFVTPEAVAVLFFREALDRITTKIGRKVEICAVAVPGLLSGGALTAIKSALELAGFPTNVILVPTTTALAMTVAHSTAHETHGAAKSSKKLLTIYHAGPVLEVAYLRLSSQGKLETKDLGGYVSLHSMFPSSKAQRIIKSVNCKESSAVVMIGNECNTGVKDSILSNIAHLTSTKGVPWRHKVTVLTQTTAATIAGTMAQFCTHHRINSVRMTGSQGRKCPDFSYFYPYKFDFTSLGGGSSFKHLEAGMYEYIHKAGDKGFRIAEGGKASHWNHDFELGPEAPSGVACGITFLQDGSFHIGPPSNSPGVMVHSNSSKLLTTWDKETVNQNVDCIIQVLTTSRKESEMSPPPEVMTATRPNVLLEARDKLRQLVRSMEEALRNAGSADDPIYEHVSKSVTNRKQLLENPNSSVEDLESAVEKLQLHQGLLV